MVNCCNHSKYDKTCIRSSDQKSFKLPRKFSRRKCKNPKGFTMRSSCAPYKDCPKRSSKQSKQKGGKHSSKRSSKHRSKRSKKTKKKFLYNPDDPKRSFDVYIDKNPNDTIPIKYTTLNDVKNTIKKLESLYKHDKYTHKRIWQVGMILYVRLKVLKDKKPKEFKLALRYFKHLGERSKIKHKEKDIQLRKRKKYIFKI